MDLTPIVEQLRTAAGAALAEVGSAAEMAALATGGVPQSPAAFVVPVEEAASGNELASVGATHQHVAVTFGVLLYVRNATAAARGVGAMEQLEALRAVVFTALHGWEPSAEQSPCLFLRGELVSYEGGALSWQDTFTTGYELRTIR